MTGDIAYICFEKKYLCSLQTDAYISWHQHFDMSWKAMFLCFIPLRKRFGWKSLLLQSILSYSSKCTYSDRSWTFAWKTQCIVKHGLSTYFTLRRYYCGEIKCFEELLQDSVAVMHFPIEYLCNVRFFCNHHLDRYMGIRIIDFLL